MHGGGEAYGGQEGGRAAIIAGGDAPPVLQPPKYDLNAVASFVATLVIAGGFGAGFRPGMQGVMTLTWRASLNQSACSPIDQQPLGSRQAVQQGGSASVVADLARSHEQADGPSVRIDHDGAAFGPGPDSPPIIQTPRGA